MEKRYQVFVSSTFDDLKEERKAIIECLLNAKYIPAGMELFSASNDEQFEYIKKIIDTCDYYVLVIAARYGSINPSTGLSFTEQEYNYAKSKGIPILTFLHSDPYNLPYNKREDDKREQLEQFRKKASSGRLCKMWSNLSELTSSVLISLSEQVIENPQKGWIRSDSLYSADNDKVVEQLNKVNITLKNELEDLRKTIEEYNEKLSYKEIQISDLTKVNEDLRIQLKQAQKDVEENLHSKTLQLINEGIVIHYTRDSVWGKKYITWIEILEKTKNDLIKGCTVQNIGKKLSKSLIIGGGIIEYDDTQRIIEFMLENHLWERIMDNLIITAWGATIFERIDLD